MGRPGKDGNLPADDGKPTTKKGLKVNIMKNLNECKEYFKDLYMNCLSDDAFDKSIFESTELARYEMFCETLKFIFGEEFKQIEPHWANEALNEFYSNKTT